MADPDERMLPSDAFAWYMEKDPVLRSTVLGIVRLDRTPTWRVLRERIDRLTRLVPRLRQRVDAPPLRLGPPRWSTDDTFDLDFHLRRLAAPQGWAQVLEFARTAAMADFDRTRPLWEFTLLTGLPGGEAAFVTKLHHSLSDGIGGMQLAALVFDRTKSGQPQGALPDVPSGRHASAAELVGRTVRDDARDAVGAVQRLVRALPGTVASGVLRPVSTATGAAVTARSVWRMVAPVPTSFSSVLGPRTTRRTLATLEVPVSGLHDAAAAAGGHLNDAFLAAAVGGLHRYHARRGAVLDEIRVTVPISIRTDADAAAGNRITLARITLPAAAADPAERIARIAAVTRRWRREPALQHTQPIASGLNLVPRPYIGGMLKRVELLASDVPGLPRPVWLAGARVLGYYPFGPTIGAALNVTLLSYAGACDIGVTIDADAVDDPDELVRCLRESFAEVVRVGEAPRR